MMNGLDDGDGRLDALVLIYIYMFLYDGGCAQFTKAKVMI